MTAKRHLVLGTSGLGTRLGGIGLVSELIEKALRPHIQVKTWRHPHKWARPLRLATFGAQAAWGALKHPKFVFYEHVDLAQTHALLPHLKNVPYGVFIHGEEVWRPLNRNRQRALERATLRITNSRTTIQDARKINPWFPDAQIAWLGIADRSFPSTIAKQREPIALIVARMDEDPYKGHHEIVSGWKAVLRTVPDAQLLIVGEGAGLPKLKARVANEGIPNVRFLGFVSNEERDALYQKARLFLFPSTKEGFGLAAVEAAAAGVPVLGVRGTVMEEVFAGDQGVVLVDKPVADQIAAATAEVLASPEKSTELGQKARARVEANFLEKHFQERLLQSFKTAISDL